MKVALRWGVIAGLLFGLFACGKRLPTVNQAPTANDTTRVVLAEMFSTKNCSNCFNADTSIHALVEEYGLNRLIEVEYHPLNFAGADSLGTPKTNARCQYYGVVDYPQCFFDGRYRTGYPNGGQIKEAFHDTFEVESARRTPVVLGLAASQSGVATVKVKALGSVPTPLVLQTAVVVDSIYYLWFNGSTTIRIWWRYVVQDMIPDQNGDTLRLAQGDSLIRTKGFTIQPNWNLQRIYLVAFVQNPATKEVLQSAMVKLIP